MSSAARVWIGLGSLLGGLAVVAGSFGAHGLEGRLSTEQLETFEVAVRYQMYHALALVLIGLLAQHGWRGLSLAAAAFVLGTALFSGCLYAWIFSGVKTFALIVPIGGMAFIAGWFVLVWSALAKRAVDDSVT